MQNTQKKKDTLNLQQGLLRATFRGTDNLSRQFLLGLAFIIDSLLTPAFLNFWSISDICYILTSYWSISLFLIYLFSIMLFLDSFDWKLLSNMLLSSSSTKESSSSGKSGILKAFSVALVSYDLLLLCFDNFFSSNSPLSSYFLRRTLLLIIPLSVSKL